MKKYLLCGTVLLLSILCGCQANRYNKAMEQYKCCEYEDALWNLSKITDYEDSTQKMVEIVSAYTKDLIKNEQYDKATSVLQEYAYLEDYSVQIEGISAYKKAKGYLKIKDYSSAIDILRDLDQNYFDCEELVTSYDELSNSPFIGKRSVTASSVLGTKYKMTIDVTLGYKGEKFVLNVYKTVKTLDGYLMLDDDYSVYAYEIKDNTISKGKYKWKMENGYLVETDNGSTYYYR